MDMQPYIDKMLEILGKSDALKGDFRAKLSRAGDLAEAGKVLGELRSENLKSLDGVEVEVARAEELASISQQQWESAKGVLKKIKEQRLKRALIQLERYGALAALDMNNVGILDKLLFRIEEMKRAGRAPIDMDIEKLQDVYEDHKDEVEAAQDALRDFEKVKVKEGEEDSLSVEALLERTGRAEKTAKESAPEKQPEKKEKTERAREAEKE